MTLLPPGFEALEPFAEKWAISYAAERADRRLDAPEAERIAFFAAGKDLLAPALDYLDKKPLDRFDATERRLMTLLLSLAHVAIGIEVQGPDEAKNAQALRHMRITRAPADT